MFYEDNENKKISDDGFNQADKISSLSKVINHQGGNFYYTGIAIKNYILESLFKADSYFTNKKILSGKWSAYAHYSPLVSFINIIDKLDVKKGDSVLVHPLTPSPFVNVLKKRGLVIKTVKIHKESLEITQSDLKNYVSSNPVSLVLFYGFNGIYAQISKSLKYLSENKIKSVVFIDNYSFNQDIFDCFNNLTSGGFIINYGDNLVDQEFNSFLEDSDNDSSMYISWVIEDGIRSLLEYHLKNSENVYQEVLEAWFYILLKIGSGSSFKSKITNWGYVKLYSDLKKFSSVEEAVELIINKTNSIKKLAIPDIFFEFASSSLKKREISQSLSLETERHSKMKNLYKYFSSQVRARDQGSLEIVKILNKKDYTSYFFYSTEKNYWEKKFSDENIKVRNVFRIHEDIIAKLPEVEFMEKYLVSINLDDLVSNNVDF